MQLQGIATVPLYVRELVPSVAVAGKEVGIADVGGSTQAALHGPGFSMPPTSP